MFIKLHVDDTRLILNVNEIETIQEIKNGSKYHDYCTKYGAKTIIKVKGTIIPVKESITQVEHMLKKVAEMR